MTNASVPFPSIRGMMTGEGTRRFGEVAYDGMPPWCSLFWQESAGLWWRWAQGVPTL